jgi:hypothetical protein
VVSMADHYGRRNNVHKFSSNLTGNTIHLRSVVRNSDHWTREAVGINFLEPKKRVECWRIIFKESIDMEDWDTRKTKIWI